MSWELTGERPWQRADFDFNGTTVPKTIEYQGDNSFEPVPVRRNFSYWYPPLPEIGGERTEGSWFCISCSTKIDFKKGEPLKCPKCRDREAHELAGMEHHENIREDR